MAAKKIHFIVICLLHIIDGSLQETDHKSLKLRETTFS